MAINGAVVGEGRGRDVMGHPFEALLWLVNTLAQRGKSLTQGMVVMTGSLVATKFVNPGDAVSLSVDGLGEVRLSVV
jgi:2-keto-4-pentenoate hydratase